MTISSYVYIKFCRPTEEINPHWIFDLVSVLRQQIPVAKVLSVSQSSVFAKILGLKFLPEVAVSQTDQLMPRREAPGRVL